MKSTGTKEDLSINYISTLCAYSGISYEIMRHDDDSTDGILHKIITLDDGQRFNAQLRVQLKCTSSASQYKDCGDHITYRLKMKNYNDLRLPTTMPIILGLLILPESEDEWISWSTEELILKGCMYWKDLYGEKEICSNSPVNISIDKKNVINGENLLSILEKIAKEEW